MISSIDIRMCLQGYWVKLTTSKRTWFRTIQNSSKTFCDYLHYLTHLFMKKLVAFKGSCSNYDDLSGRLWARSKNPPGPAQHPYPTIHKGVHKFEIISQLYGQGICGIILANLWLLYICGNIRQLFRNIRQPRIYQCSDSCWWISYVPNVAIFANWFVNLYTYILCGNIHELTSHILMQQCFRTTSNEHSKPALLIIFHPDQEQDLFLT